MRRCTLLLAILLLLVWVVPAQAIGTYTITAPAEGATVKSPVVLDFLSNYSGTQSFRLEAAPGHDATAGFVDARVEPVFKPGTKTVEHMVWKAEGFNPGPYTLRFQSLNPDTGEVVSQGMRNVVLEGPDYSPRVTLNAPATVGGVAVIGGAVVDADLATWRLEVIDSAGQAQTVAEGAVTASFPVMMDAAGLKDGPYTLRLTATDRVGQETAVEQKVQVRNAAPSVQVGVAAVDPVLAKVPVTYSAGSPVRISVTVDGQKSEAVGTVREGTVNVPVSFRGMAPGQYTALVTVEDSQGRVGKDTFTVLVREALPAAKVEAPAAADGDYLVHVTLPEDLAIARMEMHVTTSTGTEVSSFPTLPSGRRFSLSERAVKEGVVAYRAVLYTPEGRVSESDLCSVVTDRQAARLGKVSVSPVDGLGLNMRWEAATDAVGVRGYEVMLVEGAAERVLARLGPDGLSYSEQLPEGEYQVYLVALDLGGHRTTSDLLKFRVQAGAVALLRAGSFLPADVPGFVEDGRTWVPLRLFGEALGFTVSWDQERQAATIVDTRGQRTAVAVIDDRWLRVTGPEGPYTVELPAAPRLMGGRVLVPLRALVEAFGAKVQWHGQINTVELLTE
ncbi:MAG TPA: copper amine oxidase N-terminal domain-containing protein [Symbiobacteriaceae bacterium]|nr:copper amine oxidase N-terminal domain-containing protein [Symbiobacteriaceae bacterium]